MAHCTASVTKTFTLKRWLVCTFVQSNIWNTIVKILKHPALPVEITLNRNYAR
jgi:hypothetical protein